MEGFSSDHTCISECDFDKVAGELISMTSVDQSIKEAAANLADPGLCKTGNWEEGAKWQLCNQIDLINWLQQSLTAKKFYSSDAEDLIKEFKKK